MDFGKSRVQEFVTLTLNPRLLEFNFNSMFLGLVFVKLCGAFVSLCEIAIHRVSQRLHRETPRLSIRTVGRFFSHEKEMVTYHFFHFGNTCATVYLFIKIKKNYFPDFLGIDTFEAPFLEVAFAADFVGAAFF